MWLLLGLAAAQNTIDFDTLAPGCNWGSHEYPAYLDVTFSGGGAVLDECGNFGVSGHTSPNFLAFNPGAGFAGPETLTFAPAASLVEFHVGSSSVADLTATAYNAAGGVVDTQIVALTGAVQLVSLQGAGIVDVTVDAPAAAAWILDDLYYENITCDAYSPDADGDGVCDDLDACPGGDDTLDADADGFADACDNCPNVLNPGQSDDDGDGFGAQCDCDDTDELVFPDSPEFCDAIDNDCDGSVDEDPVDGSTFYRDADGDGDGDPNDSIDSCDPPDGYNFKDTDCDDTNPDVNSTATEVCDGLDNNCNGSVDEISGCEDLDTPLDPKLGGCGCQTGPTESGAVVLMLGLLGLRRRR